MTDFDEVVYGEVHYLLVMQMAVTTGVHRVEVVTSVNQPRCQQLSVPSSTHVCRLRCPDESTQCATNLSKLPANVYIILWQIYLGHRTALHFIRIGPNFTEDMTKTFSLAFYLARL